MRIHTSRRRGFTLVEIMIVVSIIGLLAVIAIPSFITSRTTSQTKACINNLRQIDSAKQQWALENRQTGGATPAQTDLEPYLVRGISLESYAGPARDALAWVLLPRGLSEN